jgi:predicted esterase
MQFLYILIEVEADSLIHRDRAYQNGDGFIVTIAMPRLNNEETDEFYVLGFSPPIIEKNIPPQKFIWYRNIDLSFQKLNDSKISVVKKDKKIYYQVIIYWKELYPFHPLLLDKIGFNLCFVKAYGQNDKSYHLDVYDENIQSEQHKRIYRVLTFERPSKTALAQTYCTLSRNNLKNNGELLLNIVYIPGTSSGKVLHIEIRTIDSSLIYSDSSELHTNEELTKLSYKIPVENFTGQNYALYWKADEISKGRINFTLLPDFDFEKSLNDIYKIKDNISEGSRNTLLFMHSDLNSEFQKLKSYEYCPGILKDMNELIAFLEKANKNIDTLEHREGIFRRGFRSIIDSSFRPYTIRIPENFDRSKKYPLMVYLHGSGDDDRTAFKMKPVTSGDFIELYPNGRGTSNVYSTAESQEDILESINDVVKNYSIDTGKIVLSGFSMGGYGVYRTYYEHPELFKGLAIFSGHPNLANEWLGEGHPDFLKEKFLSVFNGVNIFIFHGTQDRNCPYEKTVKLVEKLKDAGANVDFVSEETGHSFPSPDSYQKFLEWLKTVK